MLGILFFMFRMEEYIVQSTVISSSSSIPVYAAHKGTAKQDTNDDKEEDDGKCGSGWLVDLVIVPFLCIKDSAAAAAALI